MFNIFIPYVNQRVSLDRAVASLGKYKERVIVLNNSGKDLTIQGVNVFSMKPTLPFSVLMNYMKDLCVLQPYFFFMHDDAQASEEVIETLIEMASKLNEERHKWGVILTQHDALALYNAKATKSIDWDTNLPQYYADYDYFRSLTVAGYQVVQSNLDVKHDISSTLKSDPIRRIWVDTMFLAWKEYYTKKWGGHIGDETFTKPFNL